MLKKIYILILLSLFLGLRSQTNNHILDSNGLRLPDVVNYCPGESFNLKVNASATSTGNYTMQSSSGFSVNNGSTIVPFSDRNGNNRFSQPISLGFTFDFWGKKYTQVVVGSNGRLVFSDDPQLQNLHQFPTYQDLVHSGNTSSSTNIKLPSPEYNKVNSTNPSATVNMAQIFAGYTDLGYYVPNDYNKVTYSLTTYSGMKAFIVSFFKVPELTTNYNGVLTSQILLVENNRFYINIVEKTLATQNAIIGSQNELGTKALWPVNNDPASVYNNEKWNKTSGSLAFEFIPSQNLTPKIEWFKNGTPTNVNPQPNNNFNNYSPTTNSEKLEVKISYFDPSGTQVGNTESSFVTFNQIQKVNISNPTQGTGCAAPSELHVINPDPNLTYDWFNAANPATPFAINTSTVNVSSGNYYVKAKSTSGNYCGQSDTKTVASNVSLPPFLYAGKTIAECDTQGLASKTFDLLTLTQYSLGSGYTVEFLENGNVIANAAMGYNVVLNSGQSRTFQIRVTGNNGCVITETFTVKYLSLPQNSQAYTDQVCDGTTQYTVAQFKNKFFSGSNLDIRFSVPGNDNLSQINPYQYPNFNVKIKHPDFTCESVGTVSLSINPPVVANTPDPNDPNLQQCASSSQVFDLPNLFNAQVNPSPNVTITYHTTLAGAQSGDNSIRNPEIFRSGSGDTPIYIRVVDKNTGCVAPNFPMITLTVYKKPTLLVSNPIVKTNCAGNTVFDLTQNISTLTNAQPPVIVKAEYFSETNQLLTAAQITNYDAAIFGTKPYIKLTYNSTCGDIVKFDLKYNPKPTSLVNQIIICGQNSYSLSDFKAKVIANPSNYTFTDQNGNALPANLTWATLPFAINFYMTDTTTGCKSNLQTVNLVSGNPTAVLKTSEDFTDCDNEGNLFDGKRYFNLDALKSSFTNDVSADFKYFKDAALSQSISANYLNETPFNQKVYAQVTSSGFCPTKVEINLKVNIPSKSSKLQGKYFICFGEQLPIDAGSENSKWEWSDGQNGQTAIFTKAGNYSVKLTNAQGCSYTHNFVISAENQPVIQQINQTNDKIEVVVSGGVAPYEYSFDGGSTWQTSNILLNPVLPEYHIQVRSTLASGAYCLGEMKSIYTIKINNSITPNGDGFNDFWSIDNLDKMEEVNIIITDRYGKAVFSTSDKNNLQWDGKSSGRILPTGTYWYVVKWHDPATNKNEVRNGWILLKNR